jgi:hypothetical protein
LGQPTGSPGQPQPCEVTRQPGRVGGRDTEGGAMRLSTLLLIIVIVLIVLFFLSRRRGRM